MLNGVGWRGKVLQGVAGCCIVLQCVAACFSALQCVAVCYLLCAAMCCSVFVYYSGYGVATISRLLKIIGLFCKRALQKRRYSATETHNFKEPTNHSHLISRTVKDVRAAVFGGVL